MRKYSESSVQKSEIRVKKAIRVSVNFEFCRFSQTLDSTYMIDLTQYLYIAVDRVVRTSIDNETPTTRGFYS